MRVRPEPRGHINGVAHRLDWRDSICLSHHLETAMRLSFARAALLVLALLAGSSAARADEGAVTLIIFKAGWIFGGSIGSGVLTFRGETYALSAGGLDYGLVFGGSQTTLQGRVRNIERAEDIAGVYGAAGAGVALGEGVRGILLTNQNGAILELSGKQLGLIANLDLSGLAITLKQ
jgi:hypothetical protein